MSDYDSDYMYLIPLKYKERQTFFENILTPSRIRGAFFIDELPNYKLDFQIIAPTGVKVYGLVSNYGIFDFNVTQTGKYTILMKNTHVNNELRVTLTMSTGQNAVLQKDGLSQTEQKLDKLMTFIKRFNVEYKFNRNLHQERYKSKSYIKIYLFI